MWRVNALGDKTSAIENFVGDALGGGVEKAAGVDRGRTMNDKQGLKNVYLRQYPAPRQGHQHWRTAGTD